MSDFQFNEDQFFADLTKKTYKLADVKHRIEKVAFDLVRFKDSDPDELWQVQECDDGNFIVARYETDSPETTTKTASSNPWSVSVNSRNNSVNIFYKAYPVAKFAAAELGVETKDMISLPSLLPKKLATDNKFVSALLKSLSATERHLFLRNNPELQETTK